MKKEKNIYIEISLKYGHWFLLGVMMSYLLTQILVSGNTIIGGAADLLLAEGTVDIKPYMRQLAGLTAAGFMAAYLAGLANSWFNANVLGELRRRTVCKLVKLEFAYFDDKGAGSIMNKLISDINETGRFFGEVLPNLTQAVISVVTIGIYMAVLDWKLFLSVILFYPALLFCADRVAKRLQKLAKYRRNQLDERTAMCYDSVQGIVVGRSYNLYEILFNKINTVIQAVFQNEKRRTRISSTSWVLQNLISWIPSIVCYLFAMTEVLKGEITVGSMFAFVVLLNRIKHSIEEIPFCLNELRETSVSMDRVQEILRAREENSGTWTGEDLTDVQEVIEFSKVRFGYGEEDIFEDLSLTVERGKTTAFVGGSGQGKSTALKLICGLYPIRGGEYSLYGKQFSDWNLESARKLFSLVSQNVFLLPETIAENVSYGKPGASMEEIQKACENANIHDFIMSLPQGYDTLVGERGVRLSGGERQRISIARAFLKDAPILLLDEPTSAIDVRNETAIKEAIERISKGRTVIIIAHRLNTIEKADKIMVFEGGKIAEQGNHIQLMRRAGVYAALYGKQEQDRKGENHEA